MSYSIETDTSHSWITRLPFFYGWVILCVAGLCMFTSGPGQTYAISLFVDPIIEDLGWSRTTISGLYTAGSLTAASGMFFVGRLLDKYGARNLLPIVVILFGFALMFISNMSQPLHLYVGFALIRTLGQGSLTLIPTTLVALWFVQLRGRVMALNSMGSVASQAILPPVIHVLISAFGWRNAWVSLAIFVWGMLLLPSILLVRRNPESVKLLPDGKPPQLQQQTLSSNNPEADFTLSQASKTPAFWLLMLAGSSQSLIGTALVFHHVSVLGSRGLDVLVAASALSVIAPGALSGIFLAGFLCDRLPNRYVLVAGQGMLICAMLLILVMDRPWQAIIYGGILGLAGGTHIITSAVIWPNYYGREHLGTIRGVVTAGMVASAALGPLPFGFLFDILNNYTLSVLIFLALPIASAIAAFIARPPLRSRKIVNGLQADMSIS